MPSNTTTSSATPRDTMTHLDFFKKLKRLNPLEPSLGILGFFFVTVLLICCFFYLDYRSVTRGLRHHGISWSGLVVPSSSELTGGDSGRLGFLDKGGDWCDIFDGNWVWDDNYPLYQSQDCSFIDAGFRCLENGRPDSFYTKWRWQPKYCNLPRYSFPFLFCLICLIGFLNFKLITDKLWNYCCAVLGCLQMRKGAKL